MKNSKILTYSDTTGTDTSTSVNLDNGILQLNTGQTTCSLTSSNFTVVSYSSVEVRMKNTDVGGITVQVSNDNGTTYVTCSADTLVAMGSSSTTMKVKVTLNSDTTYTNPTIDVLGVYMK